MFIIELKNFIYNLNKSAHDFDFDMLNNITSNLNDILKFDDICLFGDDIYLMINKSDLKIYYEIQKKTLKIPSIKFAQYDDIKEFVDEIEYLTNELIDKLKSYYIINN